MGMKLLVIVLSNPFDGKLYISSKEDIIDEIEKTKDNELEQKWLVLQKVIEDLRLALPITSLVNYMVYYTSMLKNEELKNKILEITEKLVKNDINNLTEDELKFIVNTFYESYILDYTIVDVSENKQELKDSLTKLYKEIISYKDIVQLDLAERLSWYLYKFEVKKSIDFNDYLNYILKNLGKYIDIDNFVNFVNKYFKDGKSNNIPYIQVNYNIFLRISQSIEDYLISNKLVSKNKIERWKIEKQKEIEKYSKKVKNEK